MVVRPHRAGFSVSDSLHSVRGPPGSSPLLHTARHSFQGSVAVHWLHTPHFLCPAPHCPGLFRPAGHLHVLVGTRKTWSSRAPSCGAGKPGTHYAFTFPHGRNPGLTQVNCNRLSYLLQGIYSQTFCSSGVLAPLCWELPQRCPHSWVAVNVTCLWGTGTCCRLPSCRPADITGVSVWDGIRGCSPVAYTAVNGLILLTRVLISSPFTF